MTSLEPATTDPLNSSSSSYDYYYTSEPGPETIFVPVLWSLIIGVGVITNCLVVYVVLFQMKMSTVTNYYIVNLALTDITFLLFCVPFTTLTFTLYGFLTEGICRFMVYVQQASVHATCMTLTVMSADRYFAIVYPIKSMRYRTRRLSLVLNLGVWILSYIMAAPAAIFVGVRSHWYYVDYKYSCVETFDTHATKSVYYTYVFVTTYILPLVIICACYSLLLHAMWTKQLTANTSFRARKNLQQKKRTTRMLLVVVFLFFLFWLPTHVFNCWDRYVPGGVPYHINAVYYLRIIAYSLAYSNSCVNPFVYAFMGNNFRASFRKAFPCCFRRQIGARNSTRRLQRRGTEDGGTRVTVLAPRMDVQMNVNNNMAPIDQAAL
ncbi:G-protein coupled receptor 54-like [Patiria miniata]|uniref:G-protein coupled receptors family 1 profile domain-containing protein n=1 Tax=Patiria miniata TaxID=46514 RepID=A0A913Z087_PATMI|nr:G-protein coupled receptor 54-like [Patiria miniata]XP_038045239.1 G-protein coupled receptor 54-like [Patiria miniata]